MIAAAVIPFNDQGERHEQASDCRHRVNSVRRQRHGRSRYQNRDYRQAQF